MGNLLRVILVYCYLSYSNSLRLALGLKELSPFQTNLTDCRNKEAECLYATGYHESSHLNGNQSISSDAYTQATSKLSTPIQLEEVGAKPNTYGSSSDPSTFSVAQTPAHNQPGTQDFKTNDEDRKRVLLDLQNGKSIYSSLRKILGHYGQQVDLDHATIERSDDQHAFRPNESLNKFSKQTTQAGSIDGFKPIVKSFTYANPRLGVKASSAAGDESIVTRKLTSEPPTAGRSATLEAITSGNALGSSNPTSGAYFDEPAQANSETSAEIELDKASGSGLAGQAAIASRQNKNDAINKARFRFRRPSWSSREHSSWYKAGAIGDSTDEKTLISLPSESALSSDHESASGGAPYMSGDYLPPLSSDSGKLELADAQLGTSSFRSTRARPVRARLGQRNQAAYAPDNYAGSQLATSNFGTRQHYLTLSNEHPVKSIPLKGIVKEYESASSMQQQLSAAQSDDEVEPEGPAVSRPAESAGAYESDKVPSSYQLDTNPRHTRMSHTSVQLRQVQPEPMQVVSSGELASSRPSQGYQHVIIQQQGQHQAQPQRTVYSLASAPGGLRGFLSGQSVATHLGSIGASNNLETVLSSDNNLASASKPLHLQVQHAKVQSSRDLLNQPQTLQITTVPQLGYANGNLNGNAALVRLGPGAFAPVNALYNTNSWNSLIDPLGRQMVMVNADRRELDWNFWIWPLLALVTLPLILSALFVPIFLKTVVILIQVLQSLGLLLPITNALGHRFGSSVPTSAASNQLEESTSQN